MKRTLTHYSIAAVVAYAGLCGWLYFAQDRLLYFPTPAVEIENAEKVILENGDHTLRIWKIGNGSNAVLYFGGNAENVANNVAHVENLLPDTAFYLTNYRGYGGSSGEPSEAAIIEDAALLFDHVSANHQRVSVIGRSLGTGVATWLAANRPVRKLILVTPYDSIEAIAMREYSFVPVSLLLRNKFRSIDYVPAITSPTLVLLAETDRVTPHHHAMNLVEQFPESQISVHTLPDSTHSTVSHARGYYRLIRQFLLDEGLNIDRRNIKTSL
ncbi:MAG: lysophospholipase [Woeseia sp.]|nr:lysophospholipase [Woeseia sp.]MBT8096657.1 lysophospholipase [Woeseia sp.]